MSRHRSVVAHHAADADVVETRLDVRQAPPCREVSRELVEVRRDGRVFKEGDQGPLTAAGDEVDLSGRLVERQRLSRLQVEAQEGRLVRRGISRGQGEKPRLWLPERLWVGHQCPAPDLVLPGTAAIQDRKSTRLNSSHGYSSYAVFC